ncbi:MAG: hypothetical protein NVSMB66_6210 [Candidatus Doudnabacteria bacterium]
MENLNYQKQLRDHMIDEKNRSDQIQRDIATLRDQHLTHLSNDMITIKNDVKWIKIIGGFLVAQALIVMFQLFFKIKP